MVKPLVHTYQKHNYMCTLLDKYKGWIAGIKLISGPVAKQHSNLAWSPEHFHTVAQPAIENLNISHTNSVTGGSIIFAGLLKFLFSQVQLATEVKMISFVPGINLKLIALLFASCHLKHSHSYIVVTRFSNEGSQGCHRQPQKSIPVKLSQ